MADVPAVGAGCATRLRVVNKPVAATLDTGIKLVRNVGSFNFGRGAIADLALERGTGARGLRAILEEVLLNTMFEIPGKGDVAKVVVTEQAVKEKAAPLVVMRGTSRAPRQRRAAS